MRKLSFFAAICLSFSASLPAKAQSFEGTFDFRWLSEPQQRHRMMELLSDVAFVDSKGRRWSVPKGVRIDGASIPALLWSFAGSPFVGNYRRASVIHDHFCERRSEPAEQVHKVFLEGMRADGLSFVESQSKYMAVELYGRTMGTCGKRPDSMKSLSDLRTFQGASKNLEFTSKLEEWNLFPQIGIQQAARTSEAIRLGEIENPLTFAATVELGRDMSQTNYERLQTAIAAEQPSDEELKLILLLADAAAPDNGEAPAEK
jgi:hypothetical protein